MTLEKVPDEIIQHLLYYVSPTDNLQNLQLLSRRFNCLANEPLLWRFHCCSSFEYWHQHHDFRGKLRRKPSEIGWKQLYIQRLRQNQLVADRLEEIIATKVGRLKRFEEVGRLGYDAKDYLLTQCRTDESADDYLARRHYSNALLGTIHRSIAIKEWRQLRRDRDSPDARVAGVRLERALGAFDMFVLHDQPGDLDQISQMLDDKAAEFRASQPNLEEMTTRVKALALNSWLRAKGLTGLCNPRRDYGNLRNHLIGQALRHDDHESVPIISSAIFCCLAARIGLTAQCCAFPYYVHAIIFAPPGWTLDGTRAECAETTERMFLDPYGRDDEVDTVGFQAILEQMGWYNSTEPFFEPVSTTAITLRAARHIRSTFARVLELQNDAHPELSQHLCGNSAMNMEAAMYSARWAPLMMMVPRTFEWDDCLANFLRRFASSWPEDIWLIEKYLWPLYNDSTSQTDGIGRHANRGLDDLWDHLRQLRFHDDSVPAVQARAAVDGNEAVPFKIGQVFRHSRFGWIGVITGWSDRAARPPPAAVTHEQGEGKQLYFMCFPSTGSEPHVVKADSVEIITDASQVNDDMFPLAGKFFRRFDRESCTFVSNIREQYPDD
ncbi:F-box protein [Ophiocordyceps camponoti-floridani]|uniref:F-box protein n=1 Tax=Ophiocordyceps camponoti-floridani TaxID=2030778 RepID=A0A8H4Q7R8_9HYPO|nr:F-box protein [Ophiocordyceps camponoti-floridani]